MENRAAAKDATCWTCKACTFASNPPLFLTCSMCNTARQGFERRQQPPKAKIEEPQSIVSLLDSDDEVPTLRQAIKVSPDCDSSVRIKRQLQEEEHNSNDTVKVPRLDSSISQDWTGRTVARLVPSRGGKSRLYYGTILHQKGNGWHVRYHNGDIQDLDPSQIQQALTLAAPDPLTPIGIEFVHFCCHRMQVWVQQNPSLAQEMLYDTTNHYQPSPFQDKFIRFGTAGSVYRCLDGTYSILGAGIRLKVVGNRQCDTSTWTPDQIQSAVLMALVEQMCFRPEFLQEALFADTNTLPPEACYPSSFEELQQLGKTLQRLQRAKPKDRPKIFKSGVQTQGFRWIQYWKSYTPKQLARTVEELRKASTWMEALSALTQLPGIGPYSAAQALTILVYGVWPNGQGLFYNPGRVWESTLDHTAVGPGSAKALQLLFPQYRNTNEAMVRLRHAMVPHLNQLGFAYLKTPGARRRQELSSVDLETMLCCFRRYLGRSNRE